MVYRAIHADLLLASVSFPVHCGPRALVLAFESWFYSVAEKEARDHLMKHGPAAAAVVPFTRG